MRLLNSVSDFQNYCVNHLGINSYQFECWESAKLAQGVPQVITSAHVSNTNTPYVTEESKMNITQMDIFSRLAQDRVMYVQGVVDERMSSIFVAQLLYFDMIDKNADITMYLDSPGGSVKSGLTMKDTMDYINCDKAIVNVGMAASMGSILLSNGTKGKRSSLKHSKVMLHQVSFGAQGNVQDVEISVAEAKKYNDILFNILGENMDKTSEELLSLTSRDYWMDSSEALSMGIIDKIF